MPCRSPCSGTRPRPGAAETSIVGGQPSIGTPECGSFSASATLTIALCVQEQVADFLGVRAAALDAAVDGGDATEDRIVGGRALPGGGTVTGGASGSVFLHPEAPRSGNPRSAIRKVPASLDVSLMDP